MTPPPQSVQPGRAVKLLMHPTVGIPKKMDISTQNK
jgi:hypothetical protein